MEPLELARKIVGIIEDNKGGNIILMDMRPDMVIADFFIICNGNSDRQLRALVEYVRTGIKDDYGLLPFSTEGTSESGWVLMDYSEVVVHLMLEEKREYYDLEGLWSAESSILLSIQ